MLFGRARTWVTAIRPTTIPRSSLFAVPENLWDLALPLMCQTGRCLLRSPKLDDATPLVWDEGPAWELCLTVERETDSARYRLAGSLRRGEEVLDLAQPVLLLAGGLVFYNGRITRLNDHGAFAWVSVLRAPTALSFAVEDAEGVSSTSWSRFPIGRAWSCRPNCSSKPSPARRSRGYY